MKKALLLGILSSSFFAFTFILNRSMNLSGGYWAWSACLRYFFTLPILGIVLHFRGGTKRVVSAIHTDPRQWLIWSTVGFGLFYAPLTFASSCGESWFVSATWQITIVCGVLLTPLFGRKLPIKNLICGFVILSGIFLLQASNITRFSFASTFKAFLFILAAAFAYPLGNRKMLIVCPEDITTEQRVFGMTLCSMPFWIIVGIYALCVHGSPESSQILQSFFIALFSGVAATLLFFEATKRVSYDPKKLAVVEATQCGEVLFTLIGSVLFLHDPLPSVLGFTGIAIIVAGMILNSFISTK